MGGFYGTRVWHGESMTNAFVDCCETSTNEYGSDYYNGQINNTRLIKDITSEYKKAVGTKNIHEKVKEFITRIHDTLSKGECVGVEIEKPVTSKRRCVTIKHMPIKGPKKWITKFLVVSHNGVIIASASTKKEAIVKAREYSISSKASCSIQIAKQPHNFSPTTAQVVYTRPSDEKPGRYLFIYVAPE